jgi:hypothetical protein
MSRIEKVVKEVSDLRDFYLKIQKRKSPPSSKYEQNARSSEVKVEEAKNSKRNSN